MIPTARVQRVPLFLRAFREWPRLPSTARINDPSKLARFSSHGMAPVLVPLRPSSEHILIVRAPGARDRHACHSIPFHRARSASRRTTRPPIPSLQACSLLLQGWGLIDLPLRASNEGLRRPRVARAQKIIRLDPLLCSGSKGPARVSFHPFSSCAFCEQGGHLAAPPSSFRPLNSPPCR